MWDQLVYPIQCSVISNQGGAPAWGMVDAEMRDDNEQCEYELTLYSALFGDGKFGPDPRGPRRPRTYAVEE